MLGDFQTSRAIKTEYYEILSYSLQFLEGANSPTAPISCLILPNCNYHPSTAFVKTSALDQIKIQRTVYYCVVLLFNHSSELQKVIPLESLKTLARVGGAEDLLWE